MDECEVLCNRIAILKKGVLCYIGDLKQLKNKYGEGFTLFVKLPRRHIIRRAITGSKSTDEVKVLLEQIFPDAVLKLEYPNFLTYYIPNRDLKWSKIFNEMEKAKRQEKIKEYSISETTLDHIYSHLTVVGENTEEKTMTDYLKERLQRAKH
ncbi:ATP-binding cassette sub-family A member 17-like [Stegodyphus dumicola]|uniref:ATP-binding cassette sub-family A member 17-like n=1 Tax=Stegodyphus dumicola TaxID=202533 RepID=UPI0015B075D1|nr:ATP-binding cassette sub-family A member 17-like [Stegodyphus dumicola]